MGAIARRWRHATLGVFAALCLGQPAAAQTGGQGWEPRQTIQIIVPAGRGGGADQMARLIRDIVAQRGLAGQPIQVLNRPGHGGFAELKAARGDPNLVLISLSSIFTAPLLENAPFTWRDFTPVSMLALDEFVLWVNASAPYRDAAEFAEAARRAGPERRFRMGGTGARQEDWIVTQALQKVSGAEFDYVPHRSGSEVAARLAGGDLEASVNNPIEALPGWRAGSLRPLCVFDRGRLDSPERPTPGMGWRDIPTCREAGLPVEYLMMRTVFMAPDVEPGPVAYYADLLRRVQDTPEWRAFLREGALNASTVTGPDLRQALAQEEERHRAITRAGVSIEALQEGVPLGLTSAESGQEN